MSLIDWIKTIINNNKKNAQIYAKTLKKTYGQNEALEIGLYDGKTPIANTPITININGKDYTRTTDTNGIAKLNINLGVGSYTAYIKFENETYNNVTTYTDVIIATDTYIDGINLTKNEGDNTPYQCAVYRMDNHERIKSEINLTINGVQYTRTSDTNGLYKLNINLGQGTYPLTVTYNGNTIYNPSKTTNTITINPKPPEPTPQPKTYSQEILEYFESKFGKMTCIDDCLQAIQGKGYGYYYNDQYSNHTSINRMKNRQGVNCTDSCHVFWHLGKALGYDVKCLHIGCRGGDGHVRLQFNRGDGWFNRDPAAVLNGNGITSIWCGNGTLWAVNPSWFLANLNR